MHYMVWLKQNIQMALYAKIVGVHFSSVSGDKNYIKKDAKNFWQELGKCRLPHTNKV